MSFSAQIALFNSHVVNRIQTIRRAVTFALCRAVVMDTPVLTGRLRGNWMISIGSPDLSQDPEFEDKSGEIVLREVKEVVDISDGDLPVFLTNSLPYAARIEFDGYSHTKAPEGMVRRNLARFNRIVDEQAAKARAINAPARGPDGRFLKK